MHAYLMISNKETLFLTLLNNGKFAKPVKLLMRFNKIEQQTKHLSLFISMSQKMILQTQLINVAKSNNIIQIIIK